MAVDLSFYKSYIAEEIREEGRAEVRSESVRIVLKARGIDVSEEVSQRMIAECADPEIAHRWLCRAVTATSAAEIFGDEQAS